MRLSKKDERELAGYFEKNRDNPNIWSTKSIPVRPRRGTGPSTVFSLRLTGAELTLFITEANRRGISVSELIREATLRELAAVSDTGGLKEAAASLRRIADQLEREASADAAYPPVARRPVLAAREEPGQAYAANTEEQPAQKPPSRRR